MKNILIIGLGEIGSSILNLYNNNKEYKVFYSEKKEVTTALKEVLRQRGVTDIKDVNDDINISVAHVCIRFSKSFKDVISSYIKKYTPDVTLIHSTIAIGTTTAIYNITLKPIVHTPVMGVHPNLTEGIKTFTKIVGPVTDVAGALAVEHLSSLYIKTKVYKSAEESEAAKLFSTSYYGTVIRFMQEVHDVCTTYNIDFDNVYSKTNDIYNEGYKKLGMDNVIRPVLKYMGKGTGGHCVYENAVLLRDEHIVTPSLTNIIKGKKNIELSR